MSYTIAMNGSCQSSFLSEVGCSVARAELWLFRQECWFRNNGKMCEGGSAFFENGTGDSENMEGMVYTKQIKISPAKKKNSWSNMPELRDQGTNAS